MGGDGREGRFCREEALKRNWVDLGKHHVVNAVVPLHHPESRAWLEKNWVKVGALSWAFLSGASPVDDICAYFGEEVAFFFAYTEHYNRSATITFKRVDFGSALPARQDGTRGAGSGCLKPSGCRAHQRQPSSPAAERGGPRGAATGGRV